MGRTEVLGEYYKIYVKLFSYENKLTLLSLGGFSYIFSIFIIGIKTKVCLPKKNAVTLGLISTLIPFLMGVAIEEVFEIMWNLKGFKGFSLLIYTLSAPAYPTIYSHVEDLNLSSADMLSSYILSASLITEFSVDVITELLKYSYEVNNHVSPTTLNPISCILGFFIFVFLFFRPLTLFLCNYSSFTNKSVIVILIVTSIGLCNYFVQDNATVVTLILGIAIPRRQNISSILIQIEEALEPLLFLYITVLTIDINIFCIQLKGRETILCVILIIITLLSRFSTSVLISRKWNLCSWQRSWATGLIMTTPGIVEMSGFAVLKHKKVSLFTVFV